tara:strand:- start:253 stop:522 length:270 start_codon:yes stop_codon:yes gene_type:complete
LGGVFLLLIAQIWAYINYIKHGALVASEPKGSYIYTSMEPQFIYFEDSWNEKEEEEPGRGRAVRATRVEPVDKTKDDSKKPRGRKSLQA